jgi:hypothetical protein
MFEIRSGLMFPCVRRISVSVFFCLLLTAPLLHATDGDRVQFGQTITVEEGETTGDLVCIGCSIRMEGTCGDVVAIGGSVTIDGDARGDVVAIGGAAHLGENASVDGDLTTIGGRLWRHPNATVKGSVAAQSGALVLLVLVLVPLIPVVLIVALIVWLVNRNRRPAMARM